MWDRTSVDVLRSDLVPWSAIPPEEFGGDEGGRKRMLSASPSGGETSVVRVTSTIEGTLNAPIDLFVLGGAARLGSRELRPGAFAHLPSGATVRITLLTPPLLLYLGSFGAPTVDRGDTEADDIEVVDIDALAWTDMEWRGDEPPAPDVKIKWLRRDEAAGLGIAFVVGMLPGYQTSVEEVHPVCEESYKVSGDLLLGRRGIVGPGGYFFRPPGIWHGPLYSHTGNLSIIRKNAIGSTEYRGCEPDFEIEDLKHRAYLNRLPPGFEHAES